MAVTIVGIRLSVSGDAQVKGALAGAEKSLAGVQSAAADASQSLRNLAGAFAGAVTVGAFIKAADAVTTLNNQLKLATGSTQSAGQAYETLFKIAQDSRVSFTELGSTFASVSRAGQELGISQQRLLTVTESIGNAMTISGGSAASMQAALVQLGQGIASGTLRGEELNSVMEQTPRLAKALADGLGVPIGKLREMGAAGQITSEQVISALEGQAAVLRGEVAGSTLIVAQAFTQLQNAGIKAVGEFDKVTGASTSLARAIGTLSSSVSTVGQAFKDNESAITTTLGVLAGASVGVALARTAAGLGGVAAGIGGVAGAVTVLRGVVSALNPATLALLGIGAAVGGFVAYNAAQAKTADGIRRTIKELEALNKTGPGIYNRDAAGIASYNKSVEERTAKIRELRGQLAQMDAQNLDTKAEDARLLRHVASAKSVAAEGDAYDDLRTRLSAFKGDYAKYQADLKTIQEGMAKGEANGGLSEKEGIAMLTELAKKHGEVAKAATGRASAEAKVGESAALYAKAMGMLMDNTVDAAAATHGYTKTQKDLLTVFSSPGFASMPDVWKQTIAAQAEAIITTEQLTEAEKLLATARAGSLKLSEAAEEAQAASADQLADRLASMRDEIALIGLTAQQVAELTEAKAEQVIADKEIELIMLRNADASAAQIAALEREINLRRQLVGAMREKTVKEAAAESADLAQKEWKKASEQIEQSLTDALMRGFESGKGFAENLRDTVENMFKTLVLRPIVSAVVSPVSGAITAGLGLPGAASAATSGTSALSGLGSLGGALGGSLGALGTGLGAGAGMIAGGGVGGWLTASTSLIGTGTAAGAAAGIGALAGPIGAALAVASLLEGLDDSGTMHTGGLAQYSAAGGTQTSTKHGAFGMGFGGVDYGQAGTALASGMAQTIVGILDTTATTFGKEAGYTVAAAFADDTSEDGAWGGLLIQNAQGNAEVNWNDTRTSRWAPREFADGEAGAKEYAAAVSRDVRNLLIEQTPDWADAMLNALGDAPTLEQLATTVGQINQVQMALASMGRASEAFAQISEAALSTLVSALGGAEASVAKLSGYYSNFYTESERVAISTQALKSEMAAFGVEMPNTRDAFRGLVDAAIAAGDPTLAASLINVEARFAAIVPAAEDASIALEKQAAAAAKAAEDATKAAEDAMKTARSNALRQLEASVARESALWQKQADAASALRDEVGAVFDTLATNITELRRTGMGDVASAAQGNQFIQAALQNAKAGLGLPDVTDLANAIQNAKSGLGMEQFATVADQKFAALKLAGELDALKGVAGEQLTGAERQLRVAEEQLALLQEMSDYWRTLLDGTQAGIDATMSVADAVRALQALVPQQSKYAGQSTTSVPTGVSAGTLGASFGAGASSVQAQPASVVIDDPNKVREGTPYERAILSDSLLSDFGADLGWAGSDALGRHRTELEDTLISEVWRYREMGSQDGFQGYFKDHQDKYQVALESLRGAGIPGFANGGNHSGGLRLVGERGWEIEATGPARYWNQEQLGRVISGGSQDMAEIVAELRALRAQVDDLNRHSRRTAEAINGNPEAPIPMVAA